ncbi:SigB/SigF/SigG family RNA polymerase sigma factor [Streptomyces griseoluteus]|uniref:SigB/SigF/SigG family RNA polymerase sigma factor n=1 Tax=Streptomyces griseoluteus TaxID=29306 RepID=UPI0037009F94
MPTPGSTSHPHDDAPDTADALRRMANLPSGPRRRALRNEVIEQWLPMAERIALRFRGRGESLEDLCQVAAVGLVKAVDRFDPSRESAFEAYAVPTITGEIKRHFRDHMWAVHVPRRVQDLRNQVRCVYRDLTMSHLGRPPTVAEVAARTRMTEGEAHLGITALDCFSTLSLDAQVSGRENFLFGDSLGESDPGFDLVDDREAAGPAIAALPERERTILYLRFYEGMSQSAIAGKLGISQMHVSRLLRKCFDRLREETQAGQG